MSKQNCIEQQNNEIMEKMDIEFQNLESVIMKAFSILEEYDKLISVAKNQNIKCGGECE